MSDEDAAYVAEFLAFCEAEDEREPGVIDLEIATARMYGNDYARELADIAAGCHPLQLFMQRPTRPLPSLPLRANFHPMATAIPLALAAVPPTEYVPLHPMSEEDAAHLKTFMDVCAEEDAQNPGLIDVEIAAAGMYGNDYARELADIEAGRHPLQVWAQRQAPQSR